MMDILAIECSRNGVDRLQISCTVSDSYAEAVQDVIEQFALGKYVMELQRKRKRRSLDANAYCWVLCERIAERMRITKEEVYKKCILEVGAFEVVCLANRAVPRWIEAWHKRGLGWQAERLGEADRPGYTNVINYFGSSVYSSGEMRRIIDNLVMDAKELGIEVMPPDELEALLQSWKG